MGGIRARGSFIMANEKARPLTLILPGFAARAAGPPARSYYPRSAVHARLSLSLTVSSLAPWRKFPYWHYWRVSPG
jgi:hypothetical protein